jgi:hypothetical protein
MRSLRDADISTAFDADDQRMEVLLAGLSQSGISTGPFASMSRKDGYVMEHRLIMARWIGRALLRIECVHHRDHDPLNNTRTNLELWPDNRSHKLAEHGRFVIGAANLVFQTASAPH